MERGRGMKRRLFLCGANGLDLAGLLDRDVSTGAGAKAGSLLEAEDDGVAHINIASDVDLDQPQVDGELLDLDIDGRLDLDIELGRNLVSNLGRGLGRQLDSVLDNVLGLELDAGSIVVGAALGDDGSEVDAEVGRELSLDLSVDLGLDSGLDRGLEGSRQLGSKSKVDVNETGDLNAQVSANGGREAGIRADIGIGLQDDIRVILDQKVEGRIKGIGDSGFDGTGLEASLSRDGAAEHGKHGQEEGEEGSSSHDDDDDSGVGLEGCGV
ncbi:hypothetical protein EDD21DRAFT_388476, partial [Dissophora ornata]